MLPIIFSNSHSVKITVDDNRIDSTNNNTLLVNKKVLIVMPKARYIVRIFIVIPKDTNLSPLRLIYIEKFYKRENEVIEEKELIVIPYKGHSQRTRDGPIKLAVNNELRSI
ncbi:MAG: hypothetical protein KGI58_00940 [Patescibacteria group bacterium]|nr:hypothetical protein [Patescibacteria group bacterium]